MKFIDSKKIITPVGLSFLLMATALLVPAITFGKIGVGVGSGKIEIQESLKPGGVYTLPALPVLNTGDEPGHYGVSVEYNQDQSQLTPPREWFSFTPATFDLEPGKSQAIGVSLTLPVKAKPGNYFAYLEAHPIKKDTAGETSVGIAAASKLYFTIKPANLFQAAYYRLAYYINHYSPWTYIVAILFAVAILISILRRFVTLNIGLKKN